jgi:hypothetical protein
MIGTVGLVSLLFGATLACAAERAGGRFTWLEGRVEMIEGSGGALLIAGLALIGFCLPFA